MQRAMLAAVLAGGVAALVGTYVLLRGMAFLGEALSHAVLPGIAVAYITGHSIVLGAFLAGVITSLGVGFVSRHRYIKEDTATGILLSGMFALGVAIISTVKSYSIDLTGFLFGNVLAISDRDIQISLVVWLIVGLALWLFHRRWIILAFDPDYAAAAGLPVGILHYSLVVLLALTIVAAMQTVGVALVLAMLVTPPATARMLAHRIGTIMLLSVLLGMAAAVAGLFISYYYDMASGASIVLVSVLLFLGALLFAPEKGVVAGWLAAR